ncbi:IS3 family transposase [Paenibacillus illinoisensis]|uniref:IS3 family transposase n=1 Tax=Paenibacillus illinoisensis TaxID=59845 RepID=UPI003D2657F1
MAKKGQTYRRYSLELKLEAVRLVNEEHMSIREVATRLDIQNKSQVQVWAAKAKQGMSLEPATPKRGRPRTKFSSMEEEMAYLRAEIEYFKKAVSKSTQGVTSKAARFQIIEDLRARHGLAWLLKLAAVSRSGYYKWRKSIEATKERRHKEHELESHLLAIHRVHPYFGYLRMTVALRREGLRVNHKKVYRLMKQLGICSVIRKKRRFFGKQASVVNPNRLERQFQADTPRTKLVTDITYIRAGEHFVYLSVIQDLYNNEIVAWHLSERNDLALVHDTLDRLRQHVDLNGVILHSDQGFQYTSKPFNRKLNQLGMLSSHSRRGNCLDNACIESFFSHLKTEKIYLNKAANKAEVEQQVSEYILFYNQNRFQKKLNDRSPVEYRETAAA